MVGGFSNRPELDVQAQTLELKVEFIGVGEIACMVGQVLVMFNTETTDPEMYPYYYANGLDHIFNVIQL